MDYPVKKEWMDEKELKTAYFNDIETTGLKPQESEVLTSAWIAADYQTLEVKEAKIFKFRPCFPKKWSMEAQLIHGIGLDEAMSFPDRKESIGRMCEWLNSHANGGFPQAFVCHAFKMGKGPYFDWAHLELMCFDHGFIGEWRKVFHERLIESTDTWGRHVKAAGRLNTENMKLNTLAAHFGIPLVHHDAKSDVAACYKIYKQFRGM